MAKDINDDKDRDERNEEKNETKFFDNDLPKDIVELLMKTHPLRKTEGFDEERYATRYRKNLGKGQETEPISETQTESMEQTVKKEVPPVQEKRVHHETTEDGIRLEIKRKRQERMHESSKRAKEEAPDERVKMIKVKSRPAKRNLSYTQADLDVSRINKEADLDAFFKTDYETKKAAREEYDTYDNYSRGGKGSGKKKTNPKNVALFSMIAAFGIFIVFVCVTLTLSSSLAKTKAELEKYAEVEQQNSDLKLTINQMEEELNQLKASGTTTENENGSGGQETNDVSATTDTPQTNDASNTYTVQSGDTFWSISEKVLGNGANYQQILDLNGMTENSPLQIGQKIKVPKK